MRPIIGIIIICLPLAHELGITQVLSVIMALFVVCVMWENFTSLIKGEKVWEKWAIEERRYPDKNSEVRTDSEKGVTA